VQQVSSSFTDCEPVKGQLTKLQTDYSSLAEHLQGVLATNEALRKSSLLLQERSAALLEELSVKEAEWSLREEKLQAAVSRVVTLNVCEVEVQFGTKDLVHGGSDRPQ